MKVIFNKYKYKIFTIVFIIIIVLIFSQGLSIRREYQLGIFLNEDIPTHLDIMTPSKIFEDVDTEKIRLLYSYLENLNVRNKKN